MNDLEKFLIEAKKSTYANSNAPKIASSRKNSNDYEYQNGNMTYHDTYFGGTNFIGEEIVYNNDKIYWGMNYYGTTIDQSLSEEFMDNALRPALKMVGEDTTIIPVRGPHLYINGEFKYMFEVDGDINKFSGKESIYKNDILIYHLVCNGGVIK